MFLDLGLSVEFLEGDQQNKKKKRQNWQQSRAEKPKSLLIFHLQKLDHYDNDHQFPIV